MQRVSGRTGLRHGGAGSPGVLVVSVLAITASWAGVGYVIGGWPGTIVGAVLGLAASAALALFISRLRV